MVKAHWSALVFCGSMERGTELLISTSANGIMIRPKKIPGADSARRFPAGLTLLNKLRVDNSSNPSRRTDRTTHHGLPIHIHELPLHRLFDIGQWGTQAPG